MHQNAFVADHLAGFQGTTLRQGGEGRGGKGRRGQGRNERKGRGG